MVKATEGLVQHAANRNKTNVLLLCKDAAFAAFSGRTLGAKNSLTMTTVNPFVPREFEDKTLEENLKKFSLVLESCVDFGSNLIRYDLQKSSGNESQLVPSLMLRHFLELIDSASILIKNFN